MLLRLRRSSIVCRRFCWSSQCSDGGPGSRRQPPHPISGSSSAIVRFAVEKSPTTVISARMNAQFAIFQKPVAGWHCSRLKAFQAGSRFKSQMVGRRTNARSRGGVRLRWASGLSVSSRFPTGAGRRPGDLERSSANCRAKPGHWVHGMPVRRSVVVLIPVRERRCR